MKTLIKLFSFVAIIFAANVIVTSCDNQSDLAFKSQHTMNVSKTVEVLEDYNDSLFINSETRGEKQHQWLDV